ncbi:type II toxin-antitoxin system VapC family toxin [Mucilaginibacter sp.]|uniref:type II toxin-antitoxin system VapC family toxin n=1 Tax=Mucilaginibacter sp. TaxID=1882438 RepID=UPI00262DD918|nr:type II toxin-antitoxin system VapC family toxin [Mucilaginibacter sp.]MDB4921373.1 Nucleotide binding protein putative, containing domain [Mucilaginibacter sp.]
MIFDTNVLIYLSKYILNPEKILIGDTAISVITKIEVLGFVFQNSAEHDLLLNICNELKVISLSDEIAEATINLRRNYRIKLPDAIIYATALVENVPLLTNNIKDFKSLDGKVKLVNPLDL